MEQTERAPERAPLSDFSILPACDVCGQVVTPQDSYSTELTAQGATCPTAMTLHQSCYEAASSLWVPEDLEDDDATCTYDSRFPQTSQWNQLQQAAEDSRG